VRVLGADSSEVCTGVNKHAHNVEMPFLRCSDQRRLVFTPGFRDIGFSWLRRLGRRLRFGLPEILDLAHLTPQVHP